MRPCAQHGQQSLTDVLGQLFLDADQILRGTSKIGLPYQPFRAGLDCLYRDQQTCPLFLKVPG